MWCLGRFLPLIIGNRVPPEDERWQLFNMLLEINDIVFSPIVNEDTIGVLEGLIEEHHATFVGLYPGRSVIPKMHYMIHFPSQMLRSVFFVATMTYVLKLINSSLENTKEIQK